MNNSKTTSNQTNNSNGNGGAASTNHADLAAIAREALASSLGRAAAEINHQAVVACLAPVDRALSEEERKREVRVVLDATAKQVRDRSGVDQATAEAAILGAASEKNELSARATDLGRLMRDGIPAVAYLDGRLARGMVYAQGVTGFAGHPKSGKTFLAVRLAVDAMRAGRHVVWLDWENGKDEALRKLGAVGAEAALLSERLTYVEFPGPPDWDVLGRHWDKHPDALGVWDSTRGILKSLNLKENDAEAGLFIDSLAQFSLKRGIPSILLDHVIKSESGSTGYARGTGDKLAGVQAQWFVKQTVPFSESASGEMELVRWAQRSGHLAARHTFKVGDGCGAMPFRRLNPDETPEGKAERAIIGHLKASETSQSLREIESAVGGTAAAVRERVKTLAQAGGRPVNATADKPPRYAYVAELDQEPWAGETLGF